MLVEDRAVGLDPTRLTNQLRAIRDRGIEVEAAEPAIGQVQLDLLAQPALGADAKAAADNQHPDHQLWVDRWAPGVAAERREMEAQQKSRSWLPPRCPIISMLPPLRWA
jgi:hypothetical protein